MDIKISKIGIADEKIRVSGEIMEPAEMKCLLVLAHGAGAGMGHSFMVKLSKELSTLKIGTLRFNFPYMVQGKKRPDLPHVAERTVEAALEHVSNLYPGLPIIAGGKSFGGRMTSQLLSKNPIPYVRAIVFYGFPLHPAGKPSTDRANHLTQIKVPMLFLQGTRDALAGQVLITEVCEKLPSSTLMMIEGADHSFKIGSKDSIVDLSKKTSEWLTSSKII